MAVQLESPYANSGTTWLRGNLHTHTRRSDGSASPQSMVMVYAAHGYDFLALSDHDQAPLPAAELDSCGLILLPAVEVSTGCPHVLDVGATGLLAPRRGLQGLLDDINVAGGFPVLCHPNWEENFNHYPWEQLSTLTNYAGIEIFNGLCLEAPGSHLALDKWDRLLATGRRVLGFANDDAHTPDETARGWNMVQATERTPAAILAALRRGSFYASSGVVIERIACEGAKLYVRAPNAQQIALFTRHGKRVCQAPGPEVKFDAEDFGGPFLRIECYGAGGAAAWSQPIYVRHGRWDALQAYLAELASKGGSTLRAFRAARPPELSGRVDDALWSSTEPFAQFIRIDDGGKPPVHTEVRAIAHDRTLYFAFRCEEPLLEDLGSAGRGSIWGNDSVEVFLDPAGRGEGCYHLVVTVLGEMFVGCRGKGVEHLPELRAQARVSNDSGLHGWSAELAVRFDPAEAAPAPGARWGLHLCRNRMPVRGSYVWSWVGSSNHNRAQYGALQL
jgi:hypothetical protein